MPPRHNIINRMKARHEHANERAFEKGVERTSDVPVVYIDPDKLTAEDPDKLVEQLVKQMERQMPGSSDLLLQYLKETEGEDSTMHDVITEIQDSGGPAGTGITVGDTKFGIMIKPPSNLDTKEELINSFLHNYPPEIREAIIENMPGNDRDWNRIVGGHEGEHANSHVDSEDPVITLRGETRADAAAMEQETLNGRPDMAAALRDLRHLSAGEDDPEHSTGILINSGDTPSAIHIYAAEEYKELIGEALYDNFDWDAYEGEATSSNELLLESPEIFFQEMQIHIHALKAGVLANAVEDEADERFDWDSYEGDAYDMEDLFTENPELYEQEVKIYAEKLLTMKENGEKPDLDDINYIVTAQTVIDYSKNFEAAYRRRALGQNVPEHQPTQIIPQEIEQDHYTELDIHLAEEARLEAERLELWEQQRPAREAKQRELEEAQEAIKQRRAEEELEAKQQETQETENTEATSPPTTEGAEQGNNTPQTGRASTETSDTKYTQGVNGPYTAEVSNNLPAGEPTINFDTNTLTVGQTTMPNTFAQSADMPDQEDITLVDARAPEANTQEIFPIPTENTDNQLTASQVG